MSPQQTAVREYNFSDAKLITTTGSIIGSVETDQALFTARGVPPSRLATLKTKVTAFTNIPSDTAKQAAVSEATLVRDSIANTVLLELRSVRTMAQNKFGVKSPTYRGFGFEGMDNLSDDSLYFVGTGALNAAILVKTELADQGLTEDMLDQIQVDLTSLHEAILGKLKADKFRDSHTQFRIDSGNEIYREVVQICNIGKDIFRNTDEAKYNDFVIYNTASGEKPPPDPNTGFLLHIVEDASDKPIENASVETNKNKYGTELTKSVKVTDADGNTLFTGLELVEYKYTVRCDGFTTLTGTIGVEAGVIKEIVLRMVVR
jgi:hypothetical protein